MRQLWKNVAANSEASYSFFRRSSRARCSGESFASGKGILARLASRSRTSTKLKCSSSMRNLMTLPDA